MPLSKHFKGKGQQVMSRMKKKYGPKKAKNVFYGTEAKQKNNPYKKLRDQGSY